MGRLYNDRSIAFIQKGKLKDPEYFANYENYLKLLDEYFLKYDIEKYGDPFCEIADAIEYVIDLIKNSKGRRIEPLINEHGTTIEYKYIV